MNERGERSQDPLKVAIEAEGCFPDRQVSEKNSSRNFPLEYRTFCAPFSAQVELTEKCNNQCVHCYNFYRSSFPSRSSLSPGKTESVVGKLGEAQVFSVTFTGGEPLLEMESLLAGIKKAGGAIRI